MNTEITAFTDPTTRFDVPENQDGPPAVEPPPAPVSERVSIPRASVVETTEGVIVSLEMPGVPREDIEITLERDELVVVGRRPAEDYANHQVLRQERTRASFRRTFLLGDKIDGSKVTAAYADGVLRLTLPTSESAKARKIVID